MKSLTKTFLILLCSFLFLNNSCKKNGVNSLPPATQVGANTFGCLVGGKAWVPTGNGVGTPAIAGGITKDPQDRFELYIRTYKQNEKMVIYIKPPISIGNNYIDRTTIVFPSAVYPESYCLYNNSVSDFITNNIYTGVVNISRFDTIQKIVSGTFSFKAVNQAANESIIVESGRFDIKN